MQQKQRVTFAPFIATCDAALDKEAEMYMKHLASFLSIKWKCRSAHTVGWLQARIQNLICVLRPVSFCIRGARTNWKGAGTEDGYGIAGFDRNCTQINPL